MHARSSIFLLGASTALLFGGCQKNAAPSQTESPETEQGPAANSVGRQSAQIGDFHIMADAVTYSHDGKTATFTGNVRLAEGSDESMRILDGDSKSSMTFDLGSKSWIASEGAFQRSSVLGLAPKRP
jgi:hypothetical protein